MAEKVRKHVPFPQEMIHKDGYSVNLIREEDFKTSGQSRKPSFRYFPSELKSFAKGVIQAAKIISERRPKLILVPERGSVPLIHASMIALRELGVSVREYHPEIVYFPNTGRQLRKRVSEISRKAYYKTNTDPREKNVLLIDEVLSGGALRENAKRLKKGLPADSKFTVVGIMQTRDGERPEKDLVTEPEFEDKDVFYIPVRRIPPVDKSSLLPVTYIEKDGLFHGFDVEYTSIRAAPASKLLKETRIGPATDVITPPLDTAINYKLFLHDVHKEILNHLKT